MASAPFDHRLVVARLWAEVSGLQAVGGVADLGAITQLRDFRTPSAFVLLAQETPIPRQPGYAGGAFRQVAVVHFGVTVAVRNYRDSEQAADGLRAVLGQIREALIGWAPSLPGARDCQLLQGKVLDYDANVLLWADVYQTQHCIGRAP